MIEVLLKNVTPLASPPQVPLELLDDFRKKAEDCTGGRGTALFLLGSDATDVADVLAPFEILHTSDLFETFTVATSPGPTALTGNVFAVPDFVIGDPDRRPPKSCDVVVIPSAAPVTKEVLDWVRGMADDGCWILSVCEGARILAEAGILDGQRATTHFHVLEELAKKHSSVNFVPGHRYIVNERVISSAGVTAGMDAALAIIEQVGDRKAAEDTACRLTYDWVEEDDPRGDDLERSPSFHISKSEEVRLMWRANRPFGNRIKVGVALYEGVSEVALSAVLDCLPRTGLITLQTFCVCPELMPVETRSGMAILPMKTMHETQGLDAVIVPAVGDHGQCELEMVQRFFDRQGKVDIVRTLGCDHVGRAFFAALDLARDLVGKHAPALAAKMVECRWTV